MESTTRPFFSLVVPCYNDGRYKAGEYLDRLLTSVTQSNLEYGDIEVILADDHSPKSYNRIVNKFNKYFPIKQILTEYNFAPGNTRQVGTYVATGHWLCFADHDDTFYPRALRTVKDMIVYSANDPIFVYADFDKVSAENLDSIVEKFYGQDNNALNFLHGKFYNLDRFWKPFQLHFPKDLRTHEDIAIKYQVDVVLTQVDKKQILHVPTPIYRWTDNPVSISNSSYNNESHPFLECAYNDYLTSGPQQYIDRCNMGQLTPLQLTSMALPFILHTWFQLAGFKVNDPNGYIRENMGYVKQLWENFKEATHYTTPVIKMMVVQSNPKYIQVVNQTAYHYTHHASIKLDNFDEWIDRLDGKEIKE